MKRFLLTILTGVILVSCSPERRIARSYMRSFSDKQIKVTFPKQLLKTNLKMDSLNKTAGLFEKDSDSSNYYRSTYIQYLNDSLFLKFCEESLRNELLSLGFIFEKHDSFDTIDLRADDFYRLHLVQMELEEMEAKAAPEDFRSIHGSNVYGTMANVEGIGSFYFKKKLNAINLNAWFELKGNPLNNKKFPVLYANHTIYDDIESDVYEGDYMFHYTFFYKDELARIKMSEIYDLAKMAGKKYAIYLFDYLLNLYIHEHMPDGKIPKHYYHYDQETKWFTIWFTESFVELNN